ncbi:hypothetical protein DL89DRAFT_4825 [Linderina pennispora]|uniref:F-box domain-containing protein n=1 Tax=Linderina pennispora TaxID=61395 RepID=A0A1Y1WKE4_9FUNG|nr:uncharacterized protein DL89DRAFT_4825 [Linderina pennispora]ORX73845.1 hypothetical protein DL89DRAFT_4825 [Linderina pennispora]
MHELASRFAHLSQVDRLECLRDILGSLSLYETAKAKKLLLRSSGEKFDILLSIPEVISTHTLSYLDLADMRTCTQVSRGWYNLVHSNRVLHQAVKRHMADSHPPPSLMHDTSAIFHWLNRRDLAWRRESAGASRVLTYRCPEQWRAAAGGLLYVVERCSECGRWNEDSIGGPSCFATPSTALRLAICAESGLVICSTLLRHIPGILARRQKVHAVDSPDKQHNQGH